MREYIAHKDENGRTQLLRDHIRGVERIAVREGKKIGTADMIRLIAVLHDAGKYSDAFQEYLGKSNGEEEHGTVNHTSAGAEILMSRYGKTVGNGELRAFLEILCYVVTAHHGMYDIVDRDETDVFGRRLNGVNAGEAGIVFRRWCGDLSMDITALDQMMQAACREYRQNFLQRFSDAEDRQEYRFYQGCLVRLLLSMQIDADWTDTGNAMEPEPAEQTYDMETVLKDAWRNYLAYMDGLRCRAAGKQTAEKQTADKGAAEKQTAEKQAAEKQTAEKQTAEKQAAGKQTAGKGTAGKEEEINCLRTQIQEECLAFTEHPSGIYCLSLPTGAGKTLNSLGYALKFAKERIGTEEAVERIFYISPFISVTEQNARVIKEAVGKEAWVLEHHSNVVNSDDREKNTETSWEERLICTTMVQFLNTLFSDRKKCIRRFHKLKRAVVILDEAQCLPVKTIHTFNLMMNFLNRMCGTTLILCTATQPVWDAPQIRRKINYSAPRDMVTNPDRKFAGFERVQIDTSFVNMKMTVDGLSEQIQREFLKVHSLLVICNRKEFVAALYDALSGRCGNTEVFYLTTNLCAEHRSGVLAAIREVLEKRSQNVLIVSTNLIEAGVDLSVECVYRSLAGIDSIAQAAGRCNRSGESDRGTVRLFELEGDEPGRYMDELSVAQQKTREILYRHRTAQTDESILFPSWMRQYYELFYGELANKMDFSLTKELQGETIFGLLSEGFSEAERVHFIQQAFRTAGEKYEVIANAGSAVIVPYGEGIRLIGELEQSRDKGRIRRCLRELQRYTVSVYSYKIKELKEKGAIRECSTVPDVYISLDYDKKKGLTDLMPDAIF